MKLDGLFPDPGSEVTFEKISKSLFWSLPHGSRRAEDGCILLIVHDFQNTQTPVPGPHPNI